MKITLKNLQNRVVNISVIGLLSIVLVSFIGIKAQAVSIDHESPPANFDRDGIKLIRPQPVHSPDEVVRFQLEALARNNKPSENAGIKIVFRFASPSNKRSSGPFERFKRIVYNPLYRSLLNHQIAHYGELRRNGDKATQIVLLTTSDGSRVGYLFALSKQKGGKYNNCWMTDGVFLLPRVLEV